MITKRTHCLVAIVSLSWISVVMAQEAASQPATNEARPRSRQGGFGPPVLPLTQILDTNQDGRLSPVEIAAAPAALKKLDKDSDGKLSAEEIGWPPQRFGGPGFPGGGFPGGPGFPGDGSAGGSGRSLAERILARDADADGKITAVELPTSMLFLLRRLDANQDGALDAREAEQSPGSPARE